MRYIHFPNKALHFVQKNIFPIEICESHLTFHVGSLFSLDVEKNIQGFLYQRLIVSYYKRGFKKREFTLCAFRQKQAGEIFLPPFFIEKKNVSTGN